METIQNLVTATLSETVCLKFIGRITLRREITAQHGRFKEGLTCNQCLSRIVEWLEVLVLARNSWIGKSAQGMGAKMKSEQGISHISRLHKIQL